MTRTSTNKMAWFSELKLEMQACFKGSTPEDFLHLVLHFCLYIISPFSLIFCTGLQDAECYCTSRFVYELYVERVFLF